MKKWQYLVIKIDTNGCYRDNNYNRGKLDELGAEGWEIVSVGDWVEDAVDGDMAQATFKREVPEPILNESGTAYIVFDKDD